MPELLSLSSMQARAVRPKAVEVMPGPDWPDLEHRFVKAEMLVVELADIGPGFNWAEPCSRGCMQLLMKYGIQTALASGLPPAAFLVVIPPALRPPGPMERGMSDLVCCVVGLGTCERLLCDEGLGQWAFLCN